MRRMGIGLGIGINRSNYAQGIFNAYQSRVTADGGVTEAGACVDAVSGLLLTASLLLIPSGYKSGKAYAEIPTNGNGDLTWTRASTALRTNSSGLLESMGSGVPRLSYMYGSCPALLLEPQRTNLLTYSNTFTNATWFKVNSSITSDAIISPDGTQNASKLVESTANDSHHIYQNALSTGSNTFTFYAKAGERKFVYAYADGAGQGKCFDLENGTVGANIIASPTSSSITPAGNGWYRCSITITIVVATALRIGTCSADGTFSYLGNGTSGLYIYGAQCEAGAYPTTYIPTTTASATRVADSFSRNNIYTNGLITSSGGTWFVELRGNLSLTRDISAVGLFIANTTGGNDNSLVIRAASPPSRLSVAKYVGGAFTQLFLTTTDTVKIAIKWNGSTADVFVNGTKQVSATAFTATNMENLIGGATDVPKFIQQMALYPSPLSDTDCTTLTTL